MIRINRKCVIKLENYSESYSELISLLFENKPNPALMMKVTANTAFSFMNVSGCYMGGGFVVIYQDYAIHSTIKFSLTPIRAALRITSKYLFTHCYSNHELIDFVNVIDLITFFVQKVYSTKLQWCITER